MTHWEMASVMCRRSAPAQQSDPAHPMVTRMLGG